jgi:single-stranded-DNA-specific exonuclease
MNWEKKDVPPELVRDLAAKYGCELLAASILARRGITGGESVRYYLEDDPRHLRDPFELSGMEDAVDRILAAKDEGEKVLVFGDRDVDGITSTALLTGALTALGLDVTWPYPSATNPTGFPYPRWRSSPKITGPSSSPWTAASPISRRSTGPPSSAWT